jgi:hypothetical protein
VMHATRLALSSLEAGSCTLKPPEGPWQGRHAVLVLFLHARHGARFDLLASEYLWYLW